MQRRKKSVLCIFTLTVIVLLIYPLMIHAQDFSDRPYLRDRGIGVPSSMFGTYIPGGKLVTYSYFEYYWDHNSEYKPAEIGYGLDVDFRGKYRGYEGLLFIGYGFTDWLAWEFEAAYEKATLVKSPDDTSSVPDTTTEAGLGDVESQLRFCALTEKDNRPMIFGSLETVFPLQKDRVLIGTSDWEFLFGTGIAKGFSFGTITLRWTVEYDGAENVFEPLGEYAVEYLKRISPHWRVFVSIEGEEDETELITEAQWHITTDQIIVKLNNALGVTSKATDWAPEVGLMFFW